MQTVRTPNDLHIPVEHGRQTLVMKADNTYVLHDIEVANAKQAEVELDSDVIPTSPRAYDPDDAMGGSLIVPFIGGMGDALCMQPVLATIARRHPALEIDIATTPGPAEIFELFPEIRAIRPYPLDRMDWGDYDLFLSMEVVQRTNQQPGRSLPQIFAQALGLNLDSQAIRLSLDSARRLHPRLATIEGPIVGLAVGGQAIRSYPLDRLIDLVGRLARRGVTCVLLGWSDETESLTFRDDRVIDLRSKTENVRELASCLNRMDVLVAHDSFILHLAGALQRPSIGVFAPTTFRHAEPYPSVMPQVSGALCAPCHCVDSACPKGFQSCIAWEDQTLSPCEIAKRVCRILGLEDNTIEDYSSQIAV